jgi:hypothetical protein
LTEVHEVALLERVALRLGARGIDGWLKVQRLGAARGCVHGWSKTSAAMCTRSFFAAAPDRVSMWITLRRIEER